MAGKISSAAPETLRIPAFMMAGRGELSQHLTAPCTSFLGDRSLYLLEEPGVR